MDYTLLQTIYGPDADQQAKRYEALARWHEATFGPRGELWYCSAPGRTEIAGNHTDHQHGRVLSAAVNMDTVACAAKNDTGVVTLHSRGFAAPFVVDLADLRIREDEKETTFSLIRGVAARLRELGYEIGGFDAVVDSTVFKGSGLSSSAAFEVMLAGVFDALYNGCVLDPLERAKICKFAENNYFGKPSGLLDQMTSSVGGLVTMDFAQDEAKVEALSYDFARQGLAPVVVAAGGEHGNLTSEYAQMPAEMLLVAKAMGKSFLREVDPREMEEAIPRLKGRVPDRAILRALHFFDEDARVPMLVEALKDDDMAAFLAGIVASGESSWKLLQNLYVPGAANQEMALALELSRRMLAGKGAWRIHGGGFAGTILAFVPLDMLPAYAARMDAVFGTHATNVLAVRPLGPVAMKR